MNIVFIQTGGSIDKDYPKKTKGYGFEIKKPAVTTILKTIQPTFSYSIIPLLKKDSLDITLKDRDHIKQYCEQTDSSKIIITHGTDTMLQTAEHLSTIKHKTIILTGSFTPERFKESDAMFNIGLAIGAVQCIPQDVFIAMNGRIMPWNQCKRNKQTGRFELKKIH